MERLTTKFSIVLSLTAAKITIGLNDERWMMVDLKHYHKLSQESEPARANQLKDKQWYKSHGGYDELSGMSIWNKWHLITFLIYVEI